jgi:hypothetical protein
MVLSAVLSAECVELIDTVDSLTSRETAAARSALETKTSGMTEKSGNRALPD